MDDALARYLAERDARCPGCGYNLRGLKEGTCPECGFGLNLGAVRELDRRRRFDREWRKISMLEMRWVAAAVVVLFSSAFVASREGSRSAWLALFQSGGEGEGWAMVRGIGLITWGAIAAIVWSLASPQQDLPGSRRIRNLHRATWCLVAAHALAGMVAAGS